MHCCLRLRGILDLTGFNMLRHVLDGALDWLRAAWAEVRKGLRPYTGES